MSAKVWLIGAGPGDPELLTLKAVRALGEADVVLIDDLVNPEVLVHCPRARVVKVGKRGGCRSTPQAFIHRLMARYARQGLCVARLKGGDPSIFGRSGEELAWLAARGVICEEVNGITAGLAAATACGIPLTLRGVARSVTLVTAHTEDGALPNWNALANSGSTLVIYMGVSVLAQTAGHLLDAGLDSSTPVAMVERASLPSQREYLTTLGAMAQEAARVGLQSPAILIVGEVAAWCRRRESVAPLACHDVVALASAY